VFRSKGLIVHWPDVPEGQTAPMQFGHSDRTQAANMRVSFTRNAKLTYAKVSMMLNKKRHRWA